MEDRAHALVAVAFLVALSAGAAFVAWWMQAGRPEVNYYYVVSKYSVGGLQAQAPVKFKGIQVGTVQHIELDPSNSRHVRILVTLVHNAPVTSDTYAELTSQGVTGMSYIELKGDGKGKPLSSSQQNPAVIHMHASTLQRVEQSGSKILSSSQQITDRVSTLLDKKNRAHIDAILAQLDSATRKLNTIENALIPTLKRLPPMIDSAHRTLHQSQAVMQSINHDAQVFARLGQRSGKAIQALRTRTLPRVNRLADSLNRTADRLNRTIEQVDALARQLNRQPRSLIFGGSKAPPGPGEPGFKPPGGGRR